MIAVPHHIYETKPDKISDKSKFGYILTYTCPQCNSLHVLGYSTNHEEAMAGLDYATKSPYQVCYCGHPNESWNFNVIRTLNQPTAPIIEVL